MASYHQRGNSARPQVVFNDNDFNITSVFTVSAHNMVIFRLEVKIIRGFLICFFKVTITALLIICQPFSPVLPLLMQYIYMLMEKFRFVQYEINSWGYWTGCLTGPKTWGQLNTTCLKEQFNQKWKKTVIIYSCMLMESGVKFDGQQNISGASQLNSGAAFF